MGAFLRSWVPFSKIAGRAMEGAYQQAREQVAPHLAKSGPEADALMQSLIEQAQRKAALGPPQTDELTRALMLAGQVGRQNVMGQ